MPHDCWSWVVWCFLAAISGPFQPTWQKRSTKTKEAATQQKNKTNKTGKQQTIQTALKMRGLPCGSMRVAVIMYAKMCPDSGFATYLLTDSSLASNLWFLALLLGVIYVVGMHSVSATQQHWHMASCSPIAQLLGNTSKTWREPGATSEASRTTEDLRACSGCRLARKGPSTASCWRFILAIQGLKMQIM